MTSNSKLYFSDDFSPEKTKYYTLLIQVRATDFSFAVVYQDALLAWGNGYPIAELITPADFGQFLDPADYNKVIIGLTPVAFNIIPKAVYREDRLTNLAKLLDAQPSDRIYSQTLDTENQVVFKDANQILAVLTARYTYHQIVFTYKGWLQAITETKPLSVDLYLDVQPEEVHFVYYRNNKLRFYNSFKYVGAHELAYFTALTTNELQISPANTRLVISGDVTAGDANLGGLAEFFPQIIINPIQQLQQLPNGITAQQLLSLTALTLCA